MLELIKYITYGHGEWMSRWTCTRGDIVLCLVMCTGTLTMAWQYTRYSISNHKLLKTLPEGKVKSHAWRMRNIFAECAAIHAIGLVLAWFMPLYYLVAVACFHNAWATKCMNDIASPMDAFREHAEAMAAKDQLTVASVEHAETVEKYKELIEGLKQ